MEASAAEKGPTSTPLEDVKWAPSIGVENDENKSVEAKKRAFIEDNSEKTGDNEEVKALKARLKELEAKLARLEGEKKSTENKVSQDTAKELGNMLANSNAQPEAQKPGRLEPKPNMTGIFGKPKAEPEPELAPTKEQKPENINGLFAKEEPKEEKPDQESEQKPEEQPIQTESTEQEKGFIEQMAEKYPNLDIQNLVQDTDPNFFRFLALNFDANTEYGRKIKTFREDGSFPGFRGTERALAHNWRQYSINVIGSDPGRRGAYAEIHRFNQEGANESKAAQDLINFSRDVIHNMLKQQKQASNLHDALQILQG